MTTNLLDRLEYWAKRHADRVCFVQPVSATETIDYTWKQVWDQSRRIAAHLSTLKLPARSKIALLGKNSAHWIMADLAIWMAGHVSVPIYPTASAETIKYILEHSESRLMFIGKLDELWDIVQPGIPSTLSRIHLPLAPLVNDNEGRPVTWDQLTSSSVPLITSIDQRPADDLATIIYTSGSTGHPKGVMISFGAMVATARGLQRMFPIGPDDRMLSYLPLAHAAERALVETNFLYFGFRVYFAWSLDSFMTDMRRARPTLFFSVPRLWARFHQGIAASLSPGIQRFLFHTPVVGRLTKHYILGKLGLRRVRAAITGSAPLSPDLVHWYRQLGLELLEGYAMSENFSYSHGNLPGAVSIGTVGRANPGVSCRIDDNGEILVRSPGQMLGYFKMPEQTAMAYTADGHFRTGDMGEIDEDGFLRITGRVKDLFKTAKGKYVAPSALESRISASPMVESVCVTGNGLPQPIALIVLTENGGGSTEKKRSRESIDQQLRQLLDDTNTLSESHERLSTLIIVRERWSMDNGFLTPTMKIRRTQIEQFYENQFEQWQRAGHPVIWP